MKLNMKLMTAVVLAASTLGFGANAHAAFNFGGFQAAVAPQIPATNTGATATATAAAATVVAATAAAAAQSANTIAAAAVNAIVQQQQASAGISGS